MTKGLEELERVYTSRRIAMDCLYAGAKEIVTEKALDTVKKELKALNIIEKELERLEAIDNANPSQALEELERIGHWELANSCMEYVDESEAFNTIKQALLKAQEQEKALEIVFEKEVDISLLKRSENWLDYYTRFKHRTGKNTELTQEEYDLLKGVLGNE